MADILDMFLDDEGKILVYICAYPGCTKILHEKSSYCSRHRKYPSVVTCPENPSPYTVGGAAGPPPKGE